jgi:glycosyltransferase involved in cell wall biosynthesis
MRAVKSVEQQIYEKIEIIIVDDGSVDETENIIISYKSSFNIIYKKLSKNQGACVARNVGISLANGEYIAFLDSDDYYVPIKLQTQIEKIEQEKADICFSAFSHISKNGGIKTRIHADNIDITNIYSELLKNNFITTGTIIAKRECFERIKFSDGLPKLQDWDLVLRLSQNFHFCYCPEQLLVQEYQPVSITASTGSVKTLKALEFIYHANYEQYQQNIEAKTAIEWRIGIASIFGAETPRYDCLWFGATGNSINIKRIIIYILARLKLKTILGKFYQH